ncbi:MAG: hypothetical protein JJU28_15355 [Cyclobacteriaceae bacterium]|nr:hypothetical protein [Cyclobacteriaceae bacterium]
MNIDNRNILIILLSLALIGVVSLSAHKRKLYLNKYFLASNDLSLKSDSLEFYRALSMADELFISNNMDSAFYWYNLMSEKYNLDYLIRSRLEKDSIRKKLIGDVDFFKSTNFVIDSTLRATIEVYEKMLDDNLILSSKIEDIEYLYFDSLLFLKNHYLSLEQKLKDEMVESLKILEIPYENDKKGSVIFYIGQRDNSENANGYGVGFWPTGGVYKGFWYDNLRHGNGKYVWKDGEYYEGEYLMDQRHGKGKYTWKNGEYYIGEWEQGRRHGFGSIYYPNGKVKYEGVWVEDRFKSEKAIGDSLSK